MTTLGIYKHEENMNRIVYAMLLTAAAIQASLKICVCLNPHHDPALSIAMAPWLLIVL